MKKYISECIHLVKIAPLPGAIVDSSGYIVACNQFLKKDFLLSDDSISFGALLSPIDLDEFMKFLNEVRKFGYYQTELTFVNKVKKMVYARHIKSLNIFLVFIVSQEYKTKFSNLLNKFNVLFNNLDCGILITDRKMKIINFNISAKQILELSEVNLKNSYVPFLSKRKIKKIKNIINEHDLFEGQCHYKTTDNKDLILNVKCIGVKSTVYPDVTYEYIFFIKVIDHNTSFFGKYVPRSFLDPLTGCMTRYALNNMLKYRIELVTEKNNLALLFLDLNKFKNVNDSFGHAIGDKVLCEAARRIKICLRSNDIVCRYGGDEFVIVLERINKDKAIEVARRIYKELQQPYKVDNYTIDFLSCSIGLAFAPTDTKDFKQLIEKADEAMYFAKKHSDANCIVIAQEIDKSRERKLSLELLNAFKRDEIYFKFHPILNLRQDKVIGCEVLSRWLNLHFDEVYPDVFIELVKKLSLEERFDTYVLENSILELREVILSNDILIFINLFPESFISESFFYKIQYILDQNYSLKGRLVLEITEESMINNLTLAAHFIQKYRKLGVKIAIDDFGKGFSSLNYLKNLDVDFIKIDRVFISNLNENNRDKAIVKAISSLAYALNSRVLAEGVETEAQLNILKSLDVEYVQGYYFAKPMGIKKLFDFLQNKHYQ